MKKKRINVTLSVMSDPSDQEQLAFDLRERLEEMIDEGDLEHLDLVDDESEEEEEEFED